MRVLFVVPPALSTHLYVQTPLAWALRAAGHQVCVAVQPDLAPAVARTGLTSVVVGPDMLETLGEIDQAEPAKVPTPPGTPPPVQTDYAKDDPQGELVYLTRMFLRRLCDESLVDDLVDFARSWRPHLVIWDQLCYAGAVAAQVSGAVHARMLFGTDALVQLSNAASIQRPGSDPLRDWMDEVLHRFGTSADEHTTTGHWTIDTMPPWTWQPTGPHYLPMRHLAFNGPGQVPGWLREPPSRPRVCLTLGLSHQESGVARASAAELLDAVADLDAEIIATIGGSAGEGAPTVPDNVRAVDFVPLNALLPSCTAIVHHGGTGTFASAYEHGTPQLVVPSTYWSDKWFGPVAQASGLMAEGAGVYVADSDQLTAEDLRASLIRVLKDDSFTANAARLQEVLLSRPTPHDVVAILERLTAR
jgi:glycosyltransferase (activator-dependent family)